RPRRRPAKWIGRSAVLLALAGGTAGCATPPDVRAERLEVEEGTPFAPVDLILLEDLRGAWNDGDLALVERLIERARATSTDPRVLDAADDYERRLLGYQLSRSLDLSLRVGAAEDDPRLTRVALVVVNRDPRALTVNLLTPTLERRVVSLSSLGLESRQRQDDVLTDFEPIAVPGSGEASVELARFQRASGGIASRERYTLDPAGAWLSLGDDLLPVDELPIATAGRTGIASILPSSPVPPEALIEYLDDPRALELPEEVFMPALLERTVRIHPSERERAIELLGEHVEGWGDDRVARAAPALRWVTDALEPGGDPRAWRIWFASRSSGRAALDSSPTPPSLLIPGAPPDLRR
ncbi:MAG: hypothetical protein AAFZ65_05825, partial [Planctomycetota bacterium]